MEGGISNSNKRKFLANQKLDRIKMQSDILNPNFIVPFSSMVHFCHEENYYMNDLINTPEKAVKFIERYTNSNPYLIIPFECWNVLNKKIMTDL